MPRMADTGFVQIAKALADPTRHKMLREIRDAGELTCKDVCERFRLAQPTISHHIKELAEAGLIDYRREGKCAHFKVRAATMAAFRQNLAALSQFPASGPGTRPRRSTARAKVSPKAVAG